MPEYRLTYPATIYATVAAPNVNEAKQKLADILQCTDGSSYPCRDDADKVFGYMYPDTDASGMPSTSLVGIEDVGEDVEEDHT